MPPTALINTLMQHRVVLNTCFKAIVLLLPSRNQMTCGGGQLHLLRELRRKSLDHWHP
jgi:hypothetical protein